MKGNVVWVSFLAMAVVRVAAPPATADRSDEVSEGVIIGVPEGMTGAPGAIRGVNGAGAR